MARTRTHGDFQAHGREVRNQVTNLSAIHLRRKATLGVDPKLVLVFELEDYVEPDEFRRADLTVLDASGRRAIVAFADDPHLAIFTKRLEDYQSGGPDEQRTLPHEVFFDNISKVRRFGREDRVTTRLRQHLESLSSKEDEVRLDVELWHPGDASLGTKWMEEVRAAIEQNNGRVVDRYANHSAGLLLMRAYASGILVDSLAEIDQIARIDALPNPGITPAQLYSATPDTLPSVESPPDTAPLVALIDSGVRSAHPLIAPALQDAVALSSAIPDGEDAAGHGTRVAGLLLHGSFPEFLRRDPVPRPFCRLLSIRVLDHRALFPEEELWERDLEEAIRYAAEQDARIVNLSIGDSETIYRGPRSTPVAGLLDHLAKELGLVIIVSVGNVQPRLYGEFEEDLLDQYPVKLLQNADASLLDPAPSALAITVGGTCNASAAGGLLTREVATRRPFGQEGWPSPVTRHGPGIANAVKPEVCAPSGSLAFDLSLNQIVKDEEVGVVTSGGSTPERLLEVDVGTSFAAPLATRIVAAVAGRYPQFGPNLLRALLLQGSRPVDFENDLLGEGAARKEAVRRLMGFGEIQLAQSIESSNHRVVLVAQEEIPVDGVHIFELPIPRSFFESGGSRGIEIALSYDPYVRPRRLDYLSSKMDFHLVRGLSADQIDVVFLSMAEEEVEAAEEAAETDSETIATPPPTPSKLGRNLLKLEPSATVRSRGTNQVGRVTFGQRLKEEDGDRYLLVVRNTNRWADTNSLQPYALAVAMSRDEGHDALYADLQVRLEVPVEVELEH